MKKAMTQYMSVLSDHNFDILEEIIVSKYMKFTDLYWLLKEYSDFMVSMKYQDAPHDTLKIEVTLSGIDIDRVMEQLQLKIPTDGSVLIWNKKKVIHIEITKNESEISA